MPVAFVNVDKSVCDLRDSSSNFKQDGLSLNQNNSSSPADQQFIYEDQLFSDFSPENVLTTTTEPAPDGDLIFLEQPFGLEDSSRLSPALTMMWPNWHTDLPSPGLLYHLTEVFFTHQTNARRLFHAPTFMKSLTLPPSHPQFPITPILHAICAISPIYTAAALLSHSRAGGVFQKGYRITEQSPESFMEQQALLAKEAISRYWSTGDRPVQALQANIILSWYLWNHAKLFDAWDCIGRSLRMISLLNLNACPKFESIAADDFIGVVLLPPAESFIEEETRRNIFWLAYAMDRTSAIGSTFAIDHNDLGQFFPIRGDLFENGNQFFVDKRQWAHTKDVLLIHPEDQCDSFTIYIKGTMLISQVKTFTQRYRIHLHASHPQSVSPNVCDPRDTQAFRDLEKTVLSFRKSLPPYLRSPINGNVVDRYLYAACMCAPVAVILLHEPLADARNSGCISSVRMLEAARNILDFIYMIWSTSYDITLLDLSSTLPWYLGGRVLARALQIAIETNSQDQISILRTELAFVQVAIRKVGERIPIAREHSKILDRLTDQLYGVDPFRASNSFSA